MPTTPAEGNRPSQPSPEEVQRALEILGRVNADPAVGNLVRELRDRTAPLLEETKPKALEVEQDHAKQAMQAIISRIEAAEKGAEQLGPAVVRALLEQFARDFPHAIATGAMLERMASNATSRYTAGDLDLYVTASAGGSPYSIALVEKGTRGSTLTPNGFVA